MSNRYIMPEELKTSINVYKRFSLGDVMFMTGWAFGTFIFTELGLVHEMLSIPFWVFSMAAGLFLIFPAKGNPGKKQYQAIWIYLKKYRGVYKPESVPKKRRLKTWRF